VNHLPPTGGFFVGGIDMKLLQKWQCHRCEKGWLVIKEDAQDQEVGCPYCLKRDQAEAVAEQSSEDDYEDEMGCLWPEYNEFDKLAHMMRAGRVSQEEGYVYVNARLRGEKPKPPWQRDGEAE
jgi:hypothetical protein